MAEGSLRGWFDGRQGRRRVTHLQLRTGDGNGRQLEAGHPASAGDNVLNAAAERTEGDAVVLESRIRDARHGAGMSSTQLAHAIGMTVWKLEEVENGRHDAGPHVAAIARATGRPEPWFFGAPKLDPLARPSGGEHDEAPAVENALTAVSSATERTLVLAAITLLVTIRVFTELIPILPRAANFVDVPIFLVLILVALAQRGPSVSGRYVRVPLGIAFLFVLLCAISMMTNLTRVDVAPALMFVYGFLGPVGVYVAVHRLWPPGSAIWMSKLLVALAVLQLVLALGVQFPQYLATKNPDVISGTFGENAYQMVFFLLIIVGLLVGIFTFERQRIIARATPFILLVIVAVVFLAQYRSLLITTALAILLLAGLLSATRARGALIAAFAIAGLLVTLAYVAQNVPALKFGSAIAQSREDPTLYLEQRLGPAKVIDRMFSEEPRLTFTGTGPGTYSSRGWQTFALAGNSNSGSNVAGGYVSRLTGGQAFHTDVSDKYVLPQLRTAEVIDGSKALSSPFSSYLSLLAEVGVLGVMLMLTLYVWAFLHSMRMAVVTLRGAGDRDPLPALLCATAVAFFVLLQMAVLENWFEVSRLTFLSWVLLAVTTKEFEARGLRS